MNPITRLLRLSYQIFADPLTNFKRRYLPIPESEPPVEKQLELAMNWLRLTHKITGHNGSSAAFTYHKGWQPAYPETTGYIARTFFDYSEFSSNDEFFHEGIKMCDWLVQIQKEDGGINQGFIHLRDKTPSIIFNTGMVMLGWIVAYKKSGDKKYLEALIKAGNFLVKIRKNEGLWLEHCYRNIPHAYHSRVAWAILELHSLVKDESYLTIAKDIYYWALSQQKENGYFENCMIENDRRTCNTHGIAYTLRGLLEGYYILNDEKYLNAVLKTSEVFLRKFEVKRFLPTSYNEKWNPIVKTECLTGIAQLSIIWFKLYELTDDLRYLNGALDATDLLCHLHPINSRFKEIKGAIKGSHPIWGRYAAIQYPNWATKFFADALMQRISNTKNLEEKLL
jgi:hypothetical protein